MPAPIAIIFHRLGPYHWARLAACAKQLDLIAIEQSALTSEYAWEKVEGEDGFERITLFSADEATACDSSALAKRTRTILELRRPSAVAIPGWSNPGGLAALSWCLRTKTPAVVMSDSTETDHPRVWWKEAIKTRILRLCSAALAAGNPQRDYLLQLGMAPKQIFLGYDVVDNAHFTAGARHARQEAAVFRLRFGLPERYFLASNRFIPKKNLFALLDAYADYRRSCMGPEAWKLVLLGDGPLMQLVLERRAALGLQTEVLLPGFRQYDELPFYYGLASAFVHCSTSEQWGLVVNEAMAAGLPVLVSERCGCAPDLVEEGGNGFCFDPLDVGAMAHLLSRLAGEDEVERQRRGEKSREIIARWSVERFASGLAGAVETAHQVPSPSPTTWIGRLLLRALLAV